MQAVRSEDPRDFILFRDLNEVFLLLDYLSSRPDTAIEAKSEKSEREDRPGLDEDWIEQICNVQWPPPSSDTSKAKQAVTLIRARDYLNRRAWPASGMSIAFTLMVTQKSGSAKINPFKWLSDSFTWLLNSLNLFSWFNWLRRQFQPESEKPESGETEVPKSGDQSVGPSTRSTFAAKAFPDLEGWAETFYRWIFFIRIGVIAWLVFTCFLSWYVASGTSAVADYTVAREKFEQTQKAVDDLEAGRTPFEVSEGIPSNAKDPLPPTEPVATQQASPSTTTPKLVTEYCRRWELVPRSGDESVKGYESADQHQACRALDEARLQLEHAENRQRTWLWWWRQILDVGNQSGEAAATAAWLVSILGTAVLPVCYGLLGAAAAVVRSLSHKIRKSTLAPRDLSLLIQQLALGAVIGSCIGLFFVGGDATLIGEVTLSSSAISFVAGFGVDAVFQALEALISRIFNIAPAGAPNNAATPPGPAGPS